MVGTPGIVGGPLAGAQSTGQMGQAFLEQPESKIIS